MKLNWIKSAGTNKCTVEWLKDWLDKYPGSGKRVWRICDNCSDEREVSFYAITDLCHKCSHNTSEVIEAYRLRGIEHYSTQEAIESQRDRLLQYNKDHPEAGKSHSEWLIQYYIDNPDKCAEMSEIIRNSDAAKVEQKRQTGGNDIVNHHYLYDDADLSKYTMPMTRSEHTAMHNAMRRDNYSVPHINSSTDDNGLWGYR